MRVCLDSFVKQLDKDSELLLIDDGSTDCTGEICEEYAEKWKGVRVFHKENGGCVDSRRCGIRLSRGKYLVFADGDDYVDGDYFSNLRSAVRYEADLYILNHRTNTAGSDRFYISKSYLSNGYLKRPEALKWILGGRTVTVWDKIYVADLIRDNHMEFTLNITYGDDYYINLMYMAHVEKVYVQDTASYYHYCDSPTSVCSNDKVLRRLKEMEIVYKEGVKLIREQRLEPQYENLFKQAIISNFIMNIADFAEDHMDRTKLREYLRKSSFAEEVFPVRAQGVIKALHCFALKHRAVWLCVALKKLRIWKDSVYGR